MYAAEDRLGRFVLRRQLGSGGRGVVYEAHDEARREVVALKILQKSGAGSRLLELKQEFRAVADIRHPNLLPLYELFVNDRQSFFTMQLVDGVRFDQWVRGVTASDGHSPRAFTMTVTIDGKEDVSNAAAPPERVAPAADMPRLRAAIADIADAICALHAHGKLHRDLKPSNVMVRADGQLSVLDYGLVIEASRVNRERFEGTPNYAAPEQASGGQMSEASDWYALGVMLFESLTSELPFAGSPLQAMVAKTEREARSVDELVEGAPRDLVELCAALLRRDPRSRPSGREVLQALAKAPRRPAPPALFGRADELASLESAIGSGETIVVEGASGIGKSTLLRAFLERARMRGCYTLTARCHPREQVPRNAFDGIGDDLARILEGTNIVGGDDLAALAHLFPVLSLEHWPDSWSEWRGDGAALRARATDALRRVLLALASTKGLVIAIDDMQWADADSRLLLTELLASPLPGALVVLSQREDAVPIATFSQKQMSLGPLSERASRELATSLITLDGDAVARVLRAANGHPLFIREVALYATDATVLDDALRTRVSALDSDSRGVMEVLALAAKPPSIAALAAAADLAPERCVAIVRTLDEMQLTRPTREARGRGPAVEPFHDRVREAVSASLSRERARELHDRLYEAYRAAGEVEAETLVFHLSRAGREGPAAELATTAARRAEQLLAFDRAAVLYREAIALGGDDPALQLARAEALVNAHRAAEAAEAFLLVAEKFPERRAELRRRAAELFLIAGDHERGRALLDELLEAIGEPVPRSTFAAVFALVTATIAVFLPIGTPEADRVRLLRAVAQGFAMSDNLRAAVYQKRWYRIAKRYPDAPHAAQSIAMEAIFHGSQTTKGRKTAARLIAELDVFAEQTRDPEAKCWAMAARAVVDALSGVHADAIERVHAAEQMFRQETRGNGWAISTLQLLRSLRERIRGDVLELRRVLPEILLDAERRNDRYLATTMHRGSNLIFLCDDDLSGSEAMLAESSWVDFRSAGFHFQHWLELEARVETALYRGDREDLVRRWSAEFRAQRWSLVERQQTVRALGTSMRGRALLAGAALGFSRRASLLEASYLARRLVNEDYPDAECRGWLLRAGIAAVAGDDPRSALRAAIDVADRYDLQLLGAAARARLAPLVDGDETNTLRTRADDWMRTRGVRRPDRLLAMLIPGWPLPA